MTEPASDGFKERLKTTFQGQDSSRAPSSLAELFASWGPVHLINPNEPRAFTKLAARYADLLQLIHRHEASLSERGTSGLAYSEAPDPKGPRLESQHGLEPAPGGKFHTNAAGKASEQSHFARGQENKPSPAAPSTAPQVAEDSAGRLGKPAEALQDRATSPAAAVDDPVALYGDLVVASPKSLGEMATHEWVIRALYAHAERKGMLAAAEICKRRGWSMTGEVILAAAMQAGSKP